MEILIVGALLIFVFVYNKWFDTNKFFEDNYNILNVFKEDDYDFLVRAKFGDKADPNVLYKLRFRNAAIVFVVLMLVFISSLNFLNVVITLFVTAVVFKSNYYRLRSYYVNHLHEIDLLLPYYLKSLEILIQHYTVPVAITRSLETAPEMFKPGLRDLIASIDAGDSTIEPYMAFARRYPVRDSMRMMRLLYRLSLGSQDRKQEQLIVFSRTISNLQNKSRETKYKERLEKMEKKTMTMLTSTGAGVMVILVLAIFQMFVSA